MQFRFSHWIIEVGWNFHMNEVRLLFPFPIFNEWGKNHLEINAPCSFEYIQMQKDWDTNQPVFLRGYATLWMHFSWLQQKKTKFRCHIQSRNFVECLKLYYLRVQMRKEVCFSCMLHICSFTSTPEIQNSNACSYPIPCSFLFKGKETQSWWSATFH